MTVRYILWTIESLDVEFHSCELEATLLVIVVNREPGPESGLGRLPRS